MTSDRMKIQDLRELAIAVLDDEEGINQKAYQLLAAQLMAFGCTDIINAVKATGDRFYLPLGHGLIGSS